MRKGPLVREMYYAAGTPYGEMYLSVPYRAAKRNAAFASIDHALGLAAIEERVERLEHWLDSPFVLEPAERGSSRSASLLTLLDTRGGSGGLQMHVPSPTWPRLPAPPSPEDLAPYALEWSRMRARLVVADLTLDAEDLAALRDNALVLIPESFAEAGWSARIEIPSVALSMQGSFDIGERRWTKVLDADGLHLAESRARAAPASTVVEATIGSPISLSALECIGSAGAVGVTVETEPRNQVWELSVGADVRLAGRLVPLLSGHGFKLDPIPAR